MAKLDTNVIIKFRWHGHDHKSSVKIKKMRPQSRSENLKRNKATISSMLSNFNARLVLQLLFNIWIRLATKTVLEESVFDLRETKNLSFYLFEGAALWRFFFFLISFVIVLLIWFFFRCQRPQTTRRIIRHHNVNHPVTASSHPLVSLQLTRSAWNDLV